jgi:hypothetical protein
MRKLPKVVFHYDFYDSTLVNMTLEERFARLQLRMNRLEAERWQLSLRWDKAGAIVRLYDWSTDTIVRKWFLEAFELAPETVDTAIGDEKVVEVGIRRIGIGLELEREKTRDLVIFLVAPNFEYKILQLDKLSIDVPKSLKDWNFWWTNFKAGETQSREEVRDRLRSLTFNPAIVDNIYPLKPTLKTCPLL